MTISISKKITERLRGDIRAGSFSSDGKLPTERALSDRFGVARNTIRRAVDELERDGLLVRHVGRGTFLSSVAAPRFEALEVEERGVSVDPLKPSVSTISPRDLIEARLAIEPSVAASAATNATDADIDVLTAAHDASAVASDLESFERHDAAIHHQLFAMTQNPLLMSFEAALASMRVNAEWLAAKRAAHSVALKRLYVDQHGAIIRAVRERSPSAARKAMTAHLDHVCKTLLEQ